MGATYTRQSTYEDGDTITAAHTNDEFDQLLASFQASSGHTHDGTANEGGPITKLLGHAITIGAGTSGTDITVTYDGETNDGVMKWMEDEDYFEFSDDILIATTEKLQFRDTAIYINSSTDGQLDIVADTEIQIAATTIDINGAVDISGAFTLGGTTLAETISDTVGAMVTSNTESGITVAYDDADNTLDFTVGTLNQNTTGSAATLTTARTIGGTSFDGSANIAVGLAATATALATARNIGGTSFDGTGDIAVALASVGTAVTVADESSDTTCFPLFTTAASGDLPPKSGSNLTFNSSSGLLTATLLAGDLTGDVTGNADTATALATTRAIGGVNFDGSAAINLPGVNTAGNQNTSGTAAVATAVTVSDNESTNENNVILFGAGAAGSGNIGVEADGNMTYNPSTGKITATGFIGALTGDVAGNLTGTVATATQNSITTATGLTSTGALNAGSITSGFGAIDNGASAITTTGAVGTGALTAGGLVTANANMLLGGTTPTLTIGDAGAEDAKIVFDGNAQDFYVGLDDSADDLVIGLGSAVGTTPAISIDENVLVTIADDINVVGRTFSPTLTTNLGSAINLALGNNFLITTTGDVVLTFTNQIAGQSGTMKFVNDSDRAVTAHTNVAISEADLATISATGTYMVSYFVAASSAANTILVSASAILT